MKPVDSDAEETFVYILCNDAKTTVVAESLRR